LNHEFKALTAAIQQQNDVLNRILSTTTAILHAPTEPPSVSLSSVFMPRPGRPGSLDVFTSNNISNYLDNYNAECGLYAVKPEHRAICFPRYYCTPEIKEIMTLLPGYESRDWTLLQSEIKKFYWQSDHPKNTHTALKTLIRNAADLALSVYVLKFTSITNAFVANNVLSPVNRVVRLLEGLDEKMREKVIEFSTQKGWQVSNQDIGVTLNFDEIKKFLEHKALTIDRISVYN
jgi:hypothetical protein